eukprot:2469450-Prorocentrum_lima.AAC.1
MASDMYSCGPQNRVCQVLPQIANNNPCSHHTGLNPERCRTSKRLDGLRYSGAACWDVHRVAHRFAVR